MAEDFDQQLTVFGESLRVLPQLVEGVSADRLRRIPAPGESERRSEKLAASVGQYDREPDPPHGHLGGGWLAGV